MEQVRYGIVGTGMIANMHAKAIRDAENAWLAAVYDVVPERAKKFSVDHDVEFETDFETFIHRDDIQAICVCTPSGLHADIAVPAAQAGKHVFCEKPLEVTLERADSIIDACRENNVTLACVFQSRTCRSVSLIKNAIDQGRFGKLIMADVQVPWYRTQEYYDSARWRGTWTLDGGGALMNQSIHILDLLLHFMGEPVSVSAYTDAMTHTNIEVEDTATAIVRFRNGAMGTIAATTCCAPGFPKTIGIYGERGAVTLQDDRLLRWNFVDSVSNDENIREKGLKGEQMPGGAGNPTAISHEGHRRQIADLSDVILNGSDPMVSGWEARRSVQLICGIYESARTGNPFFFDQATSI